MFPLRDENPTELTPFITGAVIAANLAVWFLVQGAGQGEAFLESLCRYGVIPGRLTGAIEAGEAVPLGPRYTCPAGPLTWPTAVTSMFLHGSWFHLLGNMWFLWVFGNNIEDSMGHLRFPVFYLLTGLAAAGAHVVAAPESGIPTVGASGAISGIMGAYLVLYPRVRVQTLFIIVILIRVIPLPAWIMLGYWFLIQVFAGGMTMGAEGGGVAYWAHVGGFVAGVALIKPFEKEGLVGAKRSKKQLSRDELRRIGWY